MNLRPLILAVLMFLSFGAQASGVLLGCGSSTSCCDPTPTQQCSPSVTALECKQICGSHADTGVAVGVEHERYELQSDSPDSFVVIHPFIWALLWTADFSHPPQRSDAATTVPLPSTPTYLATARLRL